MERKLKIRDLTMRDGQQSLFATRMNQESVDKLLPLYQEAGFYAIEVWGGAVPDSVMRYLGECPWNRLKSISDKMQGKSLLTALSRGRNLFGYVPYPTSVIEGFYKRALANGLNVMRIFDALNDLDNVRESVEIINSLGGIADGAVCYTVDPKDEHSSDGGGVIHKIFGKAKHSEKIFTDEYFIEKAKAYEQMGAKIITIKDMAGLINPARVASLMPKLKKALAVPVDFHTHCTPGYGLASSLMAIIHGVDILDTNVWYFGGGSAAPAIELIYIFCQKLGVKVDADMEAVGRIRSVLKEVRKELKEFDLQKAFPIDFDPLKDKLPAEVDALFDKAIAAAKANNEPALLDACHAIEAYFNFPKPNEIVKDAEVPGGMYSNMVAQLKQLQAEDVLEDAMKLIPKVRRDAGLVPLVTPTSQIVGSQAVVLALDRKKGSADYTNKSNQFISLVRGEYGHTPVAINPNFRKLITGNAEETPYDVNSYKFPDNPELPEYGGAKLAMNDEEYLLLELLPMVAKPFLQKRRAAEYEAARKNAPAAEVQNDGGQVVADGEPITGRVLCAPMGGTIVELHVKPGQAVKEGTPVLMYEAMKMQSELEAEFSDTVKRFLVKPGDVVSAGQPLVEFEKEACNKKKEAPVEEKPGGPTLNAPMGGTIVEINVKPGDVVKEGVQVLTYEAMKMQSVLEADFAGTVKRVLVAPGDVVRADQPLIEFEGSASSASSTHADRPLSAPVVGPTLDAPMGGTLVEVHVKPGQEVKEGTPVLTYEAMKMQSVLEAEFNATVKRILVQPGQVFLTGEHLVEFEKK